jgi:hypothetical protein
MDPTYHHGIATDISSRTSAHHTMVNVINELCRKAGYSSLHEYKCFGNTNNKQLDIVIQDFPASVALSFYKKYPLVNNLSGTTSNRNTTNASASTNIYINNYVNQVISSLEAALQADSFAKVDLLVDFTTTHPQSLVPNISPLMLHDYHVIERVQDSRKFNHYGDDARLRQRTVVLPLSITTYGGTSVLTEAFLEHIFTRCFVYSHQDLYDLATMSIDDADEEDDVVQVAAARKEFNGRLAGYINSSWVNFSTKLFSSFYGRLNGNVVRTVHNKFGTTKQVVVQATMAS